MAGAAAAGGRVSWASTVPDAIAGLLAALRGSAALDGVAVFDGPVVNGSTAMEVITVGYTGGEDEDSADATEAIAGLSVQQQRERYVVRCAASVRNGSADMAAARTRAYELVGYVGGVLTADKTLGGAVMKASLGAATLRQAQDSRGALATVVFEVAVDAMTRR